MSDTQLKVDLLLQELRNVEWDTLGTYLGLSQSEIRDIESNHQNTGRRRIVMLDVWLRKEDNPSWMKIIAALENMSETRLASQLRKKYQQQPSDENRPTTARTSEAEPDQQLQAVTERVLKVDRKDQVARELESIKDSYAWLVMSAESALETANPSPRQLMRFSQLYMSDRVSTVEELFECLGDLSFLDYALLEKTISVFLKEAQPVVSDLSDYIQQLTDFKTSTTLIEFMETIENAQKLKEGNGACKVTLRLVGGWLTKTMEDLDKLLKEIFQDKSSILAHLTIVRGSVIVSYLAPQSETDSLLKLAQAKLLFLAQVGVCDLLIGHTVVINTQNEWTNFSFESSLIKVVENNDINLLTFLLHISTSPDATDNNGWTALMYGSYYDHHRTVSILLQANANPNLPKRNGATPLFMGAQNGHSYTVSILLQANANPNLQRDDGVTPLLIAAQYGHSDTVSILLQANANPNLQKKNGATPLYMAAQNGHSDAVSILLQANANPNLQRDDGVMPLFVAAQNGHSDTVSILLPSNANPNLQTNDGYTPLLIAAENGHSDIVSILLQANANPNFQKKNGATPLYMAAQNGHSDAVSILLEANANPNLQTNDGVVPLLIAAQNDHSDAVSILLEANANPNLQTNDGVAPLLIAAENGHSDTVSILLQANANPNLQKKNGATPLFMAAQNGQSDTASILLLANANPNLQRDDGVTPLFMAAQNGHSDTVGILLQANANPNLQKKNGGTPLMLACLDSYPQIVQLLLTNGADSNVQHSNGLTALMCACHTGCLESTELLLMSGADPSIVDSQGLTALDIAVSKGHDDIIDLIQAIDQASQSSTTSPVLTATEIATTINNEAMASLNKAMEDMLVAKAESYISTYYEKFKRTLPLK